MKFIGYILTQIFSVVGVFYIIIFLLWHLDVNSVKPSSEFMNDLFCSFIYVVPIFFITLASLIKLGGLLAVEEVASARYKALKDVRGKEDQLLEYIKLAQTITKKDAKTLVTGYLDRLEKEANL